MGGGGRQNLALLRYNHINGFNGSFNSVVMIELPVSDMWLISKTRSELIVGCIQMK